MSCASRLALLAYGAAQPLARMAAALPERWPRGKKGHRTLAALAVTPVDAQFAAEVLASGWRSIWLHRHLQHSSSSSLLRFLEKRTEHIGPLTLAELSHERRPVILATPHYGTPL